MGICGHRGGETKAVVASVAPFRLVRVRRRAHPLWGLTGVAGSCSFLS